jgi:acetyl-CoA acetyltransferase family protein
MSRAPYSVPKAEQPFAFGNLTAWDTALGWRYPNPRMQELYGTESMGETAENIYEMMPDLTRQLQDAFSLESHQRAIAAIDSGKFAEEIAPVPVPQRKGDPVLVTTDERPRRDTSLESLAKLRPAFRKEGSVTAGNSSGLNDGAAAILLMSAEKADELGFKPLARVVASAAAGVPPRIMGLGPVSATRKVLALAGLSIEDIGLVELNEAFAVQSLAVMKELGLPPETTNVNGGAIALGHPLGCSGVRILTTLLHEMRRRAPTEKRPYYGLATLCVGVGQGEATIIEYIG